MPSLPKFPLFPGSGLGTDTLDPEDLTGPEAPAGQTQASGQRRQRAAKSAPRVQGESLTKREADQLRPWLVNAFLDTSGDLDKLLTHTNAAGAVSEIWQLDQLEAEALADIMLRRAQASAAVAMAVREAMSKYAYYQAGVILFPRFWQTWGFYAGFGLDVPLPGAVRQRRQRKGQQGQQGQQAQQGQPAPTRPAPPTPTRPAPGVPAAVLPAVPGMPPQARAGGPVPPASASASPVPPVPAASRPPVDQAAAEELFMAHARAVQAATDASGASATARAAALAGLPDAVATQEAQP